MRALLVTLSIALVGPAAATADPRTSLKEVLGFSDAEIARVEREPVVKEIEFEGGPREVAIAGVTHIAAPVDVVLAELSKPELLLDASFVTQIGRFGQPPKAADVQSFRIPDADLGSLRDCKVGDCKVKLQAFRIEQFQALDWDAPDARSQAEAVARRALVEYSRGYLEGGNAALAIYADKDPSQSLATGFAKLLGRARYVERHLPALERHLREFPDGPPAGGKVRDSLFWAVSDYGYKPITEVIHVVVHEPGDEQLPGAVIALKHIFATHYFQTRLEFVGLVAHADRPGETDLIHVDRSLFDGDLGRLKRGVLVRGLIKSERERLDTLRELIGARAATGGE